MSAMARPSAALRCLVASLQRHPLCKGTLPAEASCLRRYESIANNEISIQSEAGPGVGLNPLLWAELDLQAHTPRGTLLDVTGLTTP